MNTFKTPSRFMAGTITLGLLALYGFVLLSPAIFGIWGKPPPEYDPALVQTLLTLVVVAVTYYIGTSQSSQTKDDTIAAQAKAAAPTPPGTPPAIGSGNPTGKPDDPVAVTPVPPQP